MILDSAVLFCATLYILWGGSLNSNLLTHSLLTASKSSNFIVTELVLYDVHQISLVI